MNIKRDSKALKNVQQKLNKLMIIHNLLNKNPALSKIYRQWIKNKI